MSLINKDTIIQQCADGYRTASGTTEAVKYGELGNKIAELSGGSGGTLDYTITFTVEGEPYEIVSVNAGTGITAPLGIELNDPPPTGTGHFSGWKLNGESINFPYTPTSDVELNALFVMTRALEMDLSQGESLSSLGHKKTKPGWAIGGHVPGYYSSASSDLRGHIFLVSNTSDGCKFSDSVELTEFDYNGLTYYLTRSDALVSKGNTAPKLIDMTSYTDQQYVAAAKALLDYYYYVTD